MPKNDKIEKQLDKIDKNINTFTTDQFTQLRNMVEEKGYREAVDKGCERFGLEKGMTIKGIGNKDKLISKGEKQKFNENR